MSLDAPRGSVRTGDAMPPFALQGFDPAAGGAREFTLAALTADGPLVLFFYPQANTPG